MNTKAGYVTIIGKPNAGKSTLMNALLGERLSIITNKPQTTRKKILGILSGKDYQIVFLDTPGILDPSYLLQKKMVEYVIGSAKDADILIYLYDITSKYKGGNIFINEELQKLFENEKFTKIAVINKIDASDEDTVNATLDKLKKLNIFEEIIPLSALLKFNVQMLLEILINKLPNHPKYFPEDQLTDEPERFFVSEIIREKIFEMFKDEIPYSVEVIIEEFKERDKRKDFIRAVIIVERDSQKPIIIGKNGETIKKIGKLSRESIEDFLRRKVFLELYVKVKSKWRSNDRQLKNFGYITGNE